MNLITVFRTCIPPCPKCQKRRYQMRMVCLFIFSPWQWRWAYLFCTTTKNCSAASVWHAVEWSYKCKSKLPRVPARKSVIEYLEIFNDLRDPATRRALKRALDSLGKR